MQTTLVKSRVAALDVLRGFAVLNMVLYHGIYDWVYVFGHALPWFSGTGAYLWQQCICWTFILLAGAVYSYGRHPVRRGAILLGCGLVLTLVTAVALPAELIQFGVLHLLGAAMLLTALCEPLLKRIAPAKGFFLFFMLFLLSKGVPRGFLGLGDYALVSLPAALYRFPWAFPLGLPSAGFYSSDYFPLVPWLFLFWTGLYLWRGQSEAAREKLAGLPAVPGLAWLGRHSLAVYMLHQPVLMALLTVAARWL